MPVQRHDDRPVPRPSGAVPPPVNLAGVTELRLHGVGGTTPENLLSDDAPQLVAGDRIAGFYRTADLESADGERRHVEAYSWGGLTSRSAVRVLWLLLFPFALANIAGWMCTKRAWESPWRFWLHRTAVRLAALGMTVNLLLIVAMTSMDLIAYQCGAQSDCVDHWWLRWLRLGGLADHPGARVLVGAAAPIVVVVGLLALAGRSLSRYEQVEPPWRTGRDEDRKVPASTPARPNVGLADKDFWNGKRSVGDLTLLHVGAGLAFIAWITAATVRAVQDKASAPVQASQWYDVTTRAAAVALAAAALLLVFDALWRALSIGVLALGALAFAGAAVFALAQGALAADALPIPPMELPGLRPTVNATYAACLIVLGLVLVTAVVSGRPRGSFGLAPAFVAVTIGMVLLNAVGIGVMIRVADLLGNVPNPGVTVSPRPNPLFVSEVMYGVLPIVTLVPIAAIVIFAVGEGLSLWWAARRRVRDEIHAAYAATTEPAPASAWNRSALLDDAEAAARIRAWAVHSRLWSVVRRPGWLARAARGQRIAMLARDVDKLLTVMAFGIAGLVSWYLVHLDRVGRPPEPERWMLSASTWLAAALPIGVLLLMRQGWRGLESRRHIGMLWDVGTFWPRSYHPLAPPSYAERAVPELQRRLWHLHDNRGRVVLAAHSQGSVIALAALVQKDRRPVDDEVALVTFGSPLKKLYGWAFPAYFDDATLDSGRADAFGWRNLHYRTDYIGGPVLDSVDEPLSDPPSNWYVYGQQSPPLGRHSGYWIDPRVWAFVDTYSRELPPNPGPGDSQGKDEGEVPMQRGPDTEAADTDAVAPQPPP